MVAAHRPALFSVAYVTTGLDAHSTVAVVVIPLKLSVSRTRSHAAHLCRRSCQMQHEMESPPLASIATFSTKIAAVCHRSQPTLTDPLSASHQSHLKFRHAGTTHVSQQGLVTSLRVLRSILKKHWRHIPSHVGVSAEISCEVHSIPRKACCLELMEVMSVSKKGGEDQKYQKQSKRMDHTALDQSSLGHNPRCMPLSRPKPQSTLYSHLTGETIAFCTVLGPEHKSCLWPRLEHSRPCCKLLRLHLHRCRGNAGSFLDWNIEISSPN